MKKGAFFAIALAVLLLTPVGRPAAEEIPELRRLSLEELLDVPIVAASGLEERPSDASASAYVVTAETIRRRGYATLLDLLEDLPQFEVARNASETRRNVVTVRGLFGNERVVILYDGIRLTPPSGDIYALNTQFSLRGAKRVEIVVGPMSALYGPDAASAVINIVTNKGGEVQGGSASAAYGQHDTTDASLAAGRALLPGAEVAVTAHRYSSGEPFLPARYPGDFAWFQNQYQAGFERTSPFAPPSAVTTVPVRPYDAASGSLFLHARLDLKDFELGFLRTTESHSSSTGVKPEFGLYVKDAVFSTNYSSLYAKHGYVSDDGRWSLGTTLAYHVYEIDPRSRYINTFSSYQDAFKYGYDRSLEFDQRLIVKLTEAAPLILGLAFEDHSALPYTSDLSHAFDPSASAVSQGFLYPGSNITDLNGKSLAVPVDFNYVQYQNVGVFAQLQFKKWDWLQATVGARYDHSTLYGDALNPRAGVVVKPAEKLTLKLNYGEAIQAPSTFRSYAHFGSFVPATNGLGQVTGLQSFFFHVPNPDLKPEKLRELEGDAAYVVAADFKLSLNGYYTQTSNLIQDDSPIGPGTFKGWPVASRETSVNRGFTRTYGATARLDYRTDAGAWTLKPNAAYTYSGGSTAGDVLTYSARNTVQGGLEVERGKFSVYPSVIWRGRSYNKAKAPDGSLQSNGAFARVNLFVRYSDIVAKPFRLSAFAGVTNLADTRYTNASFTAGSSGFPTTPQDPRRVAGGFVVDF